MIYSNDRKLCLSGWLKNNSEQEYETPLKLQKFLFFYEVLSKIHVETTDFSHLRGYKKGPVFSNVWGDYTKEKTAFNNAADEYYEKHKDSIDTSLAKKSAFLVSSMSESELSSLTHKLNLWSSKESRIMGGEYQVDLDENDFNSNDEKIVSLLDKMYPLEVIDNSEIISLDKNYFVFSKEDAQRLTEEHFDVLLTLSENEELHNPVYVEMDDEGRLLVD